MRIKKSPETDSFWQKTTEKPEFSESSFPTETEITVIGGGIMGVSVSYWLSRKGFQVTLLEAQELGNGATGRNAGLMLPSLSPLEDLNLLKEVLEEEKIDSDFSTPGHLALAGNALIWEKICDEHERRQKSKVPITALRLAECEELLGLKINPNFFGGRWFSQGSLIHSLKFLNGLAQAAQKKHLQILEKTSVRKAEFIKSGNYFLVETSRGSFISSYLIWCCQDKIVDFFPAFKEIIKPEIGSVFASEPLPKVFRVGLAIDWGTVYWRQTDDGTVICGGNEKFRLFESPKKKNFKKSLPKTLMKAFPKVPEIKVNSYWQGKFDYTVDGKPLIGNFATSVKEWIIGGFGGHGMPMALGVGKAVAESIQNSTMTDSIIKFSPSRFNIDLGRERKRV